MCMGIIFLVLLNSFTKYKTKKKLNRFSKLRLITDSSPIILYIRPCVMNNPSFRPRVPNETLSRIQKSSRLHEILTLKD